MKLIILLGFALLLAGCEKNEIEKKNPQITGYTFHCKVDGAEWNASKDGDPFAQAMTADMKGDSVLSIAAYKGIESIGISIYSNSLNQNKVHELSNHEPYNSCAIYNNDLSTGYFTTDSVHAGEIKFTIDKSNTIIVGSFAFAAQHTVSRKVVNITDGFFSIKYQNK